MADSVRNTLKRIHNADYLTIDFINEWYNDSLYITAHTSGSTGTPKKIQLLKQDMIESAIATCKYFGINESSTLVLPLSTNYIAGKMMIVRAIVSGAKLWIEEPSNTPIKNDYGQIDLLPIVPPQSDWLASDCKFSMNINNLIIGGGVLSDIQEKRLIQRGINAYATYGMTETCSHIALRHIMTDVYKTLPNITVSVDSRNCLIINAPNFSFKTVTTSDIVKLIDDTHFKWVGRYDNVINTGGIKVFPEEIEQKLNPIIHAPFFIHGRNNDKWGSCVVLYIESQPFNTNTLITQMHSILNKYSIPKEIIFVSQFIRTESGKIKRMNYD